MIWIFDIPPTLWIQKRHDFEMPIDLLASLVIFICAACNRFGAIL